MRSHGHTARHRALLAVAMLGLISTLAYACGGSNGYGTGPGNGNGNGNNTGGHTTSIDMVSGFAFSPATDTVTVGATVTWTNQSQNAHTVTANDGSFTSGQLQNGDSYQHTYNVAGSFPYYCQNHGTPTTGMRGVIVVKP